MELKQLVNQLAEYINVKDRSNTEVSKAPVKWHINHALKVINNVCRELSLSDPAQYAPKENKARSGLMYWAKKP